MAIKKSPEPNALYVFADLEKQVERQNSLRGKGFRDVSDLIAHKKRLEDSKRVSGLHNYVKISIVTPSLK